MDGYNVGQGALGQGANMASGNHGDWTSWRARLYVPGCRQPSNDVCRGYEGPSTRRCSTMCVDAFDGGSFRSP